MKSKCVYTFIIGGYDNLKEPKIYTPGWDYICVTDNPNLKSDVWNIIQIDDETKKIEPSKKRAMSLMIGYRKWLPKHYDIVVTIGGQCVINIDLDEMLTKYGYDDTYDACICKHPDRNCVYDEANAIVRVQRDTAERIIKHVQMYIDEGYPAKNGLYASGMMIINNNSENIHKYYDQWLSDYIEFPSVRDQMTMNYSEWKLHKNTGIKLNLKMIQFRDMFERDRDIYTENHRQSHAYAMKVPESMISVVIPTYKSPDALDLCLRSAIEGQQNKNQIIVVVDGFYDLNKEVLDRWRAHIDVLNLEENVGLCRGTNLGVYNAKYDKVLIVNDDNVFPRFWDTTLEADWVDGAVIAPNQIEPYPSMFRQFIIEDLGTDPKTFDLEKFWLFDYHYASGDKQDGSGSTLPIFMSKLDYIRIGGWDENYEMGMVADWDFFLKCQLSGLSMVRTWNCHFYHFASVSTNGEKRQHAEIAGHQYAAYKWGTNIKHDPETNLKYL